MSEKIEGWPATPWAESANVRGLENGTIHVELIAFMDEAARLRGATTAMSANLDLAVADELAENLIEMIRRIREWQAKTSH